MSPPRILVFDDDLIHQQAFLAGLDARFIYRADADEAVDEVRRLSPDAVFMDYHMGARLSGADAVKALRLYYGHDELPIIAISSDTRANRRMCQVGATEGVAKMALPGRFAELVEAGLLPRSAAEG